jgi:hypothetical protein
MSRNIVFQRHIVREQRIIGPVTASHITTAYTYY